MHTLRTLVTPVVLATLLIGLQPIPAFAATPLNGGPRVRPYCGRTAAIMLQGLTRSETFRAIVDRLEAANVIVYVQLEHSLRRERLAGTLTWLVATPEYRYVRVSLNPELMMDMAVSTLGHELRHALEVANEPSVVDAGSLAAFYRRSGIQMLGHNGFDTSAARDAGDEVRKDLAGQARTLTGSGVSVDFDPLQWVDLYRDARDRTR
jgi:hypothetical protein